MTDQRPSKPREPWLAAGLSFLLPGLGQLYGGHPARALSWLAATATTLAGTLTWVLSETRTNPLEGIAWYAGLLACQWGSPLAAWLECRRNRARLEHLRRPALAAALSVVFPGLGHLYALFGRWWMRLLFAPVFLAPGLIVMSGEFLERSAVPEIPPWLADWPVWLSIPAGALLSAFAIIHSYRLAYTLAGHRPRLPRMAPLVAGLALAAWANAQAPWEAMLKREVRSFQIPSKSMEPTLLVGDRLWARRAVSPVRGDILVFRRPSEAGPVESGGGEIDFIKRVVGLPGERLEIRSKRVYINGKRLDEPWAVFSDPGAGVPRRDDLGPQAIPAGQYFMMGDNRDNSFDSRYFGPVPSDAVIGRAYKLYWPLKRAGTLSVSKRQ